MSQQLGLIEHKFWMLGLAQLQPPLYALQKLLSVAKCSTSSEPGTAPIAGP